MSFTLTFCGISHFFEKDLSISLIQISQRDILNSIDREMSGDLREGMKTVGKCVWCEGVCDVTPPSHSNVHA